MEKARVFFPEATRTSEKRSTSDSHLKRITMRLIRGEWSGRIENHEIDSPILEVGERERENTTEKQGRDEQRGSKI